MAALARVAILQERPEDARATLDEFHRMTTYRYVSPTDFAKLFLALGEIDEAFQYAEQSMLERRGWLAYMRVEPSSMDCASTSVSGTAGPDGT